MATFETIGFCWQTALDAAQDALRAASWELPAPELEWRTRALAEERLQTAAALRRLTQNGYAGAGRPSIAWRARAISSSSRATSASLPAK